MSHTLKSLALKINVYQGFVTIYSRTGGWGDVVVKVLHY